MKASVIIPTYNEGDVILECLKSLEKQTLEDFEVIIVDDGSTDGAIDVTSKFTVKGLPVSLLYQKHLGPGVARNLGAKHANSNVLVFVDADMTFSRNFLKELTKPILKEKSKGTFSKQ
jgi:glycosyltransferase involved in cell wall biosynthesis